MDDVVAVLEFEDLDGGDSVRSQLWGHARDRRRGSCRRPHQTDRVRLRPFLADGQSALDLLPEGFGDTARAAAGDLGLRWVSIPPALLPPEGLIPDKDRALRRPPAGPAGGDPPPTRLTTGAVDRVARAFVRCTAGDLDVGGDPIEAMAVRARAEGWLYRELSAPHDPHLFDPAGTAAVLHELAATASTAAGRST